LRAALEGFDAQACLERAGVAASDIEYLATRLIEGPAAL
jgi:hypothetical protein